MTTVPWQDTAENPYLNKGELYFEDHQGTCCGPIEKITVSESDVFVQLVWCAIQDQSTGVWHASDTKLAVSFKTAEVSLVPSVEGGVFLQVGEKSIGRIRGSKDPHRLKPEKVVGLDPDNLPQAVMVETNLMEG